MRRVRGWLTVGWLSAAGFGAPALAADNLMTADQLKAELGGHRIEGYYTPDGVRFVESYVAGGHIDYKDDLKADTGAWSLEGDTFCTYYDHMGGACWHVLKRGPQCYEFFNVATVGTLVTLSDLLKVPPLARAARDGEKVLCEPFAGS